MTLHANSAEDALHRLDDLVQEAGVPSQMGRIRAAVDLVVYMERGGGRRRVVEVVGVDSRTIRSMTAPHRLDRANGRRVWSPASRPSLGTSPAE